MLLLHLRACCARCIGCSATPASRLLRELRLLRLMRVPHARNARCRAAGTAQLVLGRLKGPQGPRGKFASVLFRAGLGLRDPW